MKKLNKAIEKLETEIESLAEASMTEGMLDKRLLNTLSSNLRTLRKAQALLGVNAEAEEYFITYKIASDLDGKLWTGARTACNFWNRFISPSTPIVVRLGTFRSNSNTIARAYYPWSKDGVKYGRVEFNVNFLIKYSDSEIGGTIVHEIGHTLGFGWDAWNDMFDRTNGKFYDDEVKKVPALNKMIVELGGGPGTIFSHWDEDKFDLELMTGYKDSGEHVLPVTIDIMERFGHTVIERLKRKTNLDLLLSQAQQVVFSRTVEAEAIDRDYFEETPLFEELPH